MVGRGHSLSGNLFHSDEAKSKLALEKFSNRADSLVSKVIDVVSFRFSSDVRHHGLQDSGEVVAGQVSNAERNLEAKLLVQESSSNLSEVVSLNVEEQAVDELLCRFFVGRFAWSQSLVDVEDSFSRSAGWVGVDGGFSKRVRVPNLQRGQLHRFDSLSRSGVDSLSALDQKFAIVEQVFVRSASDQLFLIWVFENDVFSEEANEVLVVREWLLDLCFELLLLGSERVQQFLAKDRANFDKDFSGRGIDDRLSNSLSNRFGQLGGDSSSALFEVVERLDHLRQRQLLGLANLGSNDVVGVAVNFEPWAFVWNNASGDNDLHRAVHAFFEVQTRRSAELRNDDSLSAIDDKGSFVRHQRKVAKVDLRFDDVSFLSAKANNCLDRSFKRHVAISTFLKRVLRFSKGEADQLDKVGHSEVVNRTESFEQLRKSLFQKPLVRVKLEFDQVGDINKASNSLAGR